MEHVHFIGIGGTGLSAIARLLLESGYVVSGSDRFESPLTRDLATAGAQVSIGHASENIRGASVVVRSSAIQDDNIEVVAAMGAGIPVLKRSAFVGRILQNCEGIAIAGTHGKSTTTAMMVWALTELGLDPSYIIGALSRNTGKNAHAGIGKYFVIEADEYDRMFLGINPKVAIINPIEHDHPDCFPTMAEYIQAFIDFSKQVQPDGFLFINESNLAAQAIFHSLDRSVKYFTFGLLSSSNYYAGGIEQNAQGGFNYRLMFANQTIPTELAAVQLDVPGTFNVTNSIAVLAVVHQLGLDVKQAAVALKKFNGIGRRFEIVYNKNGITLVDDYGHHPTAIKATLDAARAKYPQKNIIAVWQPHTYSRSLKLLNEFGSAFENADEVIITKVYAARETMPDFDPQVLVSAIQNQNVRYIAEHQETVKTLAAELKPNDVLVVFSAGDAIIINQELITKLVEMEDAHDFPR